MANNPTDDFQVGEGVRQAMALQGDRPLMDSDFTEIGYGEKARYLARRKRNGDWDIDVAIWPPPAPDPGPEPPDPGPVKYERILQNWQYTPGVQAERTLQEVIALAQRFKFTGIAVKALDGVHWMGQAAIDPSPDAISSVQELADQTTLAHQHGIDLYCWSNLRQDQLDHQAALNAQLANVCDGIFLDVEPYEQHWGIANDGVADRFMRRLRRDAPAAWVALQPDPRPGRMIEIKAHEWLPHCDALAGQHYWTTFGVGAWDELLRAQALGEQWNLPVYPTVPGDAVAGTVPDELLASFPGFLLWRVGSANAAILEEYGQVAQG